ncbi:hypothetical protein [Viridibacillus arvi]|uniref:hypothetical protein n=1 Tax=Viridibacillus arvi TaxID=263475 RepID=UPI0034CDCF5B
MGIEETSMHTIDLPTRSEYVRAYTDWYCVTAKDPVSIEQYIKVMKRLPKDIRVINQWLDEGRKPR